MVDKDLLYASWELSQVPSPCYILHSEMLEHNLEIIDYVRQNSGVEIIVALKASAMWSIFPQLKLHSDGATASSLAEARLVYEEYGQKAHTYAPVYKDSEIDEILSVSSHITFNSLGQYHRFGEKVKAKGISCGLRVNPQYSTVETALYDPSDSRSRLGITSDCLTSLPEGIDGLHFHTLCESRPEDLKGTLDSFEMRFGHLLSQIKWLNMGGGHLMTHKDYDYRVLVDILKEFKAKYPHLRIILEPGSAFTWDTGCLLSTVEDVVKNGGVTTALLDVSFACHMPDCLEMPYKPSIVGGTEPIIGYPSFRLGGNSCLAGDFIGEWSFLDGHAPTVGERILFRDMIHYTMVKTTMFNGVTHPSIAIYNPANGVKIVKTFGYEDFKNRMS